MLNDLSGPQRELADYMSALSEEAYHAGWMEGLEFDLWRAVVHGPFLESTEETFVPIPDWMRLLEKKA